MSATVIREFVGVLELQALGGGFSAANALFAGVKTAAESAGAGIKAGMDGAKASIGDVLGGLKGLGAALSVGAAAASIKSMVDEMAKSTGELQKAALLSGETAQGLQLLQFQAKASGAPIEALAGAAAHLREQFVALGGGGGFAKVHAMMEPLAGIIRQADGSMRPLGETLAIVAKRVQAVDNPLKQAAIATKLLGSAGTDLLPFLRQSPEMLKSLADDYGAIGSAFTPEDMENAKRYRLEQVRLGEVMKATSNTVAGPFTAMLADVTKGFNDWAGAGKGLDFKGMRAGMREIAETAGPIVLRMMKGIASTFEFVTKNATLLASAAAATFVVLAGPATLAAIGSMVTALVTGGAAVNLAWAPVALAIGGLALLIEDIAIYAKYGKEANTVTGRFVEGFGKLQDVIGEKLTGFFNDIPGTVKRMANALVSSLKKVVGDFFTWLPGAFKKAWDMVINEFVGTPTAPKAVGPATPEKWDPKRKQWVPISETGEDMVGKLPFKPSKADVAALMPFTDTTTMLTNAAVGASRGAAGMLGPGFGVPSVAGLAPVTVTIQKMEVVGMPDDIIAQQKIEQQIQRGVGNALTSAR